MTTPTLRTPGLRDRKRAETRARIEDAAVSLVLRDGLEQTTVHAISELADVSPRTFFNYFDSKDGAILGIRNTAMVEEQVAEFLAQPPHRDAIEAVVALLLAIFDAPGGRLTIRKDRMELLQRHPELMASQFEQLTLTHGQIAETVAVILKRYGVSQSADAEDLTSIAGITLAMCGTAVRLAMSTLAQDHTHADTEQIQIRSVALVRATTGSIA
ncbi:MAG: TetR/AcrR family transcriptional regulator [Actinomycetota bacterium]|nr:TetR/AcrR family transcriptional regulator [Actinomycetota bacterium]